MSCYYDEMSNSAEVIVAGHICLDIIPGWNQTTVELETLLSPGKLVEVGPPVMSTGGVVSNTGLALHRLGVPTRLVGKVGRDLFGDAILNIVRGYGAGLADGMIASGGESTSYTLVISPPGTDRIFFHSPGANNTFGAKDIHSLDFADARLFHFGYPPLMQKMFERGGEELEEIFRTARQRGLTASLDMAWPDPLSPAGQADWRAILKRVLPFVDIFCPSLDEILFMLDPAGYADSGGTSPASMTTTDSSILARTAQTLLEMGACAVVLKLGEAGLYLRTSPDPGRWARFGRGAPANQGDWMDRELLAPCFEVRVVGTTGAGDCAIAGFLAALLAGRSPEESVTAAAAVGACNCEKADATSGIPDFRTVLARVSAGWNRLPTRVRLGDGWKYLEDPGVWEGPAHKGGR